MSTFSQSSPSKFTPKSRLNSHAVGKSIREDTRLHLLLKTVIGTTTSSANAFDCVPGNHTFAVCAGSAVVLARVDEELNIVQTFYRAGPDAVPANASYSFYNASAPNNSADGPRSSASIFKETHLGYGSPSMHGDSSNSSPGKAKASTRTRTASCVSLSPDGRFLAVGETGYSPRICIFGCAEDASRDVPLSILNEHSNYGVHSLAFSPDSQWLCSLGNVNDGFVFVWAISKNGSARLHSSNKCISNVQKIAWMGNNIITVGTRHVKVWRPEEHLPSSPIKTRYPDGTPSSPTPKALSGRNCILGPLVESTFTCVIGSSDCTAIICTDNGEICLLDDIDHDQRLEQVATVPFKIFCISVEIKRSIVLVGGKGGKLQTLDLRKISRSENSTLPQDDSPALAPNSSPYQDVTLRPDILAIGSLRGQVITVDASHHIQLMKYPEADKTTFVSKLTKQMPAHDSAVLGVVTLPKPNNRNADFMTWSSRGIVYFWTTNGICRGELELALKQASFAGEGDQNVLTVLKALTDDSFLYGDKSGNIALARENSIFLKAHDGEMTDMAVSCGHESLTLVATCGRDRTLQIFQLEEGHLDLLQTLQNEHSASINSVRFLATGSTLLSASADRTIVIRSKAVSKDQKVAFFTTRVITLKSSPVSIAPSAAQPGILVVSTMDRQFLKYEIGSGHLLRTFKATDIGKSESVILSSLKIGCLRSKNNDADVLLCASSTDRSIRIYDPDTGSLLTKEYGQLVVSDLCLVEQSGEYEETSNVLISAGLDGTVMIWSISPLEHRNFDGATVRQAISGESSDSAQPLRRVLSRTELLEYQKSLESTQDPPTPTRSHQHSRIKKKASRLTLAATPGQNAPRSSKSAHHSPSSSINEAADRNPWRDRSSIIPAHKAPLISRTKRSASDAGQRSPSTVERTSESAPSVEQFCQSLRDYRERLTASSESLSHEEAQELERELTLTIQAIGTKTYKSREQSSNGGSEGNALDGWLARMIDERLALRLKQTGGDDRDDKVSGT